MATWRSLPQFLLVTRRGPFLTTLQSRDRDHYCLIFVSFIPFVITWRSITYFMSLLYTKMNEQRNLVCLFSSLSILCWHVVDKYLPNEKMMGCGHSFVWRFAKIGFLAICSVTWVTWSPLTFSSLQLTLWCPFIYSVNIRVTVYVSSPGGI